MEMTATENSQPSSFSSNAPEPQSEDPDQNLLNHGIEELAKAPSLSVDAHKIPDGPMLLIKHPLEDEGKKQENTDDEVREILEVISTSGKFWHDWDTLKCLLSFQLKQVLSEYPEAKMANDQQSSLLGETHMELVKRLDEALLSFMEGPPFTLQRLCEILLAARSIYPNLSKLALALEKNLSVTSTLSMSTDPYPLRKQKLDEPSNGNEDLQGHSIPIQNGVEGTAADRDEEMAEADEIEEDSKDSNMETIGEMTEEVEEDSKESNMETIAEMTEEVEEDSKDSNMETISETTGGTQETSSEGSTNSEPSTEFSVPPSEQLNSTGS